MTDDILTSTFVSFRAVLHGMAARIVGSRDDAEDAVHDAFCRLWSSHPLVRDETEAMKLSYTAVRNSAIDTLRRSRKDTEISVDDVPSLSAPPDDDGYGVRASESAEIYEAVLRISRDALTPRQSEVFRLHDIEGMDYADIASELGLTNQNVRMILSRARKTIREIYRNQNRERL